MEELLLEKLSAIKKLKGITEEMLSISLKNDYDKINKLIDERQKCMDDTNIIIEKINMLTENKEYSKSNTLKSVEKEVRDICTEINNMDKSIRKNINDELDGIRHNLYKPNDYSKLINIKA